MEPAPLPIAAPPTSRLGFMIRAFRHKNYRLFFAGQLVSLVGTFLSQVAVVWLVYRQTGEPWLLGVTGFAAQIPMLLLSPIGGVWADRVNRHRLLVVTQILSMLQSFALGALVFTHHANVWAIVALAFFQGVVNAFDLPGRQAFLVEMVTDRADLPNAIALNSTMVHAARLIGPAFAGMLIYKVGEAWCFTIDGFSYLAVIAALLAMTVTPRVFPVRGHILHELREGFKYVWHFAPIRVLLIVMAMLSLFGMPSFTLLMPVFASHFGGGEGGSRVLGFLMAASGGGALVGAIYLASRRSVVGLGRVIALSAGFMGLALLAFSACRTLWLSLLIVPFAGFGMIVTFAAANTVLQTLTSEEMRGRVMSFFSMAFLGMAPFGNLLAGWLASKLSAGDDLSGASRTILFSGLACLVASVIFGLKLPALRAIVRPIYVSKGLMAQPQAVAEAELGA